MKRAAAIFLLAAGLCQAQAPQAVPADPALKADPGNDWFQHARNLYDSAQASKDLDARADLCTRAAAQFSDYLSAFPNHANAEAAWWYLGQCQYNSGHLEDAQRCFNTLINRYGKGKWVAAAAYTLAADHYNKHEYQLAAPLFEKAATNAIRAEDRQRSGYYAGTCYRLVGHDREAANVFTNLLRDPESGAFSGPAKVGLATILIKDGKTADALKLFREVADIEGAPNTRGEAALQAALAASKLGQPDVADKYLNFLLNTPGMDVFHSDASLALMANEFARKDYKKVTEIYRAGAALQDPDKEAQRLTFAAQAYLNLNQPDAAMPLFRAIERSLPPENNLAFEASYYRLLCFYRVEGTHVPDQVDAFLQIYGKSRKMDPKIHTALLMKAESLFAEKNITESAKIYSEIDVTLLSPKNRPGFLYQRGWCLAEAGDSQGAIHSLDIFIADYPNDKRVPLALAKRAKTLAANGDTARATEDFEKLIKLKNDPELTSFAWLESARLKKSANDLPGMVAHYQGLLENAPKLDETHRAEANYWIGWGLIKQNQARESVPYLEQARKLRPETYQKHAGLLLVLGYFAAQDLDKLAAEINLADEGKYQSDIPEQALRWAGLQAFNAGRYAEAARFLGTLANDDEPRTTPKEVWRYLGKSLLESGKPAEALAAAGQVLAVEDNPSWKADGLLDKGRALFALKRDAEAAKAADEALELHPQGPINAGLRILKADIAMRANDPAAAAAQLVVVPEFIDDPKLTPLALYKLAEALEKKGDAAGATKSRDTLKKRFPDWKPPTQ